MIHTPFSSSGEVSTLDKRPAPVAPQCGVRCDPKKLKAFYKAVPNSPKYDCSPACQKFLGINQGSQGLTTGQIVGIVIGSCAAVLILAFGIYWSIRRSKQQKQKRQLRNADTEKDLYSGTKPGMSEKGGSDASTIACSEKDPAELDGMSPCSELPYNNFLREAPTEIYAHEAPDSAVVHEMPSAEWDDEKTYVKEEKTYIPDEKN